MFWLISLPASVHSADPRINNAAMKSLRVSAETQYGQEITQQKQKKKKNHSHDEHVLRVTYSIVSIEQEEAI